MKLLMNWKPVVYCTLALAGIFVAVSIMDILISLLYARWYSWGTFIATFGVGGVFAAIIGYSSGMSVAPKDSELSRWILIVFIIGAGLLFFFPLAKMEGGEYEPAFKGYGATLALTSIFLMKEKLPV